MTKKKRTMDKYHNDKVTYNIKYKNIRYYFKVKTNFQKKLSFILVFISTRQ